MVAFNYTSPGFPLPLVCLFRMGYEELERDMSNKEYKTIYYGQRDGAYHNFLQGVSFTHNQMIKNGWGIVSVIPVPDAVSVIYSLDNYTESRDNK